MPSTKELLKQRYEQTKKRSKNDSTYIKSGNALIIDHGANADDEQNAAGEMNDESCEHGCARKLTSRIDFGGRIIACLCMKFHKAVS